MLRWSTNQLIYLATHIFPTFLYIAITIMVGDKTLEELEREAAEADRLASEASLRAQLLKEKLKDAKRRSASTN